MRLVHWCYPKGLVFSNSFGPSQMWDLCALVLLRQHVLNNLLLVGKILGAGFSGFETCINPCCFGVLKRNITGLQIGICLRNMPKDQEAQKRIKPKMKAQESTVTVTR